MAVRIKGTPKYNILCLILIILLAGFLRLWQLGSIPASLTWDEAAWVYNAYSLGIDGRDEFGVFLPHFYLESFGDFKPPLYAYLSVIPVWIFGMTEFSARFASAFFGTLTVLCTYFLVRHIFHTSARREYYALTASFLFAISPWHIMLSRGAWEANIVTFLLVLGVWLFLKGIHNQKWYLIVAAFVFSLAPYTFNSGRVVTPILLLILGIGFYRELLTRWKVTLLSLAVGAVILLPYTPHLLSQEASLRFREVTYFSDISVAQRFNTQVANDDNAFWSRALHHRYLIYTVMFLDHYLDHLDPVYLFVTGDDNPKFSVQDVGQLYLWSLPFFIVGLGFLFKKREGHWWLVPLWLAAGIVPAATAWDTPHALRTGSIAPLFDIITGIGVVTSFFWLRRTTQKRWVVFGVVLVALLLLLTNFSVFTHSYFASYNRQYSSIWQYSYDDIIRFTEEQKDVYDEIRMDTSLGRPYIYIAYHTKMPPEQLRQSIDLYRESFGFVKVTGLGKYRFSAIPDHTVPPGKRILYLSHPGRVADNARIIKEFHFLDGSVSMVAYEVHNE